MKSILNYFASFLNLSHIATTLAGAADALTSSAHPTNPLGNNLKGSPNVLNSHWAFLWALCLILHLHEGRVSGLYRFG